jgi:hypothetical protein
MSLQREMAYQTANVMLETYLGLLTRRLELHLEDTAAQVSILDCLNRTLFPLLNNKPHLWVYVTQPLLATLQRHAHVPPVQQLGQTLLARLVEWSPIRKVLVETDGVQACLLNVLHVHRNDVLVSCNALASLCWFIHSSEVPLSADDIQTILLTLNQHIACPSVFGNCVCVLCGLPSTVLGDQEAKVLRVILSGMEMHKESPKVQESCLRWIRFRNFESCREELLQGIPFLIASMRAHSGDCHLQAQACDTLAMLANSSEELRNILMTEGAIDVVLHALKTYGSLDTKVLHMGMLFLGLVLPRNGETSAFGGDFSILDTLVFGFQYDLDPV